MAKIPFLRSTLDDLGQYLSRREHAKRLVAVVEELNLHPYRLDLLERQAELCERLGDKEEMISAYRELGRAYVREGLHARAIAAYREIHRLDPHAPGLDSELAQLVQQRGKATVSPRQDEARPPTRENGAEEWTVAEIFGGQLAEEVVEEALVGQVVEETAAEDSARPEEAAAAATLGERDDQHGLAVDLGQSPSTGRRAARTHERASSALFTLFETDALEEILASTSLRTYDEGAVIFREGEPGSTFFVLVEGSADAFTVAPDGETVHLAEMGPGDLFGEVSVVSGAPRVATVRAKTRLTVIEISKLRIDEIARQHPQILSVLRRFCEQHAEHAIDVLIRRRRHHGGE